MQAESPMNTCRIVIVDQQPLISRGIRTVLENEGHYTVVGEFATLDPLFDLLNQDDDLAAALVDTAVFSALDMRTTIRRLHAIVPHFPIVMLTSAEDQEQRFQALIAGVVAYEPRSISVERLLEVVAAASRGEYLFHEGMGTTQVFPHVEEHHIEADVHRSQDSDELLSAREVQILVAIASGNSNKEISKLLKISDQTVKNHITSILRKLKIKDRTAAVVYALREGWITLDETMGEQVKAKNERQSLHRKQLVNC